MGESTGNSVVSMLETRIYSGGQAPTNVGLEQARAYPHSAPVRIMVSGS